MKGSNQLILNQETMIEILQDWIDKEMSAKVKVMGFGSQQELFIVSLGDSPEEPR